VLVFSHQRCSGGLKTRDGYSIADGNVVGESPCTGGRANASGLEGVFDRDRKAMQRSPRLAARERQIGGVGAFARPIRIERNDSIELGIKRLDPREVVLQEFAAGDFAIARNE
jgi:hypothetical protein